MTKRQSRLEFLTSKKITRKTITFISLKEKLRFIDCCSSLCLLMGIPKNNQLGFCGELFFTQFREVYTEEDETIKGALSFYIPAIPKEIYRLMRFKVIK